MKEIRLKTDRLKYWLSVGAQPSDRVGWILGKFGVLPPPPPKFSPLLSIPKDERPKKVDIKKAAAAKAAASSKAGAAATKKKR